MVQKTSNYVTQNKPTYSNEYFNNKLMLDPYTL